MCFYHSNAARIIFFVMPSAAPAALAMPCYYLMDIDAMPSYLFKVHDHPFRYVSSRVGG